MKEAKPLTPDLIDRLDDKEATVSRAAHAALKEMTKQDFGPTVSATDADREKALAAWKAWWAKQKK